MSNISTKRSATRTAKNKTLAGTKNFFGIRAFNNRHDIIRDIKASHPEPEIHGNKIWKAATLLVDFLEVDPPRKNTHVMDLGCGWGLSGIYCAQQHQARTL
ncbi:MAG: methyltransferase [Gammaproteobacteria bacterium]